MVPLPQQLKGYSDRLCQEMMKAPSPNIKHLKHEKSISPTAVGPKSAIVPVGQAVNLQSAIKKKKKKKSLPPP